MIRIFILLLLFLTSCSNNANDKFTRSECIVQVKLSIDKNITKKDWILINNAFYTEKHDIYMNNKLNIEVPSINIPLSDNIYNSPYLYAMYNKDCKNKSNNIKTFLNIIKFRIPNFPDYEITNNIILPSANTIYINGPWWKDGCEWVGNNCIDKIKK